MNKINSICITDPIGARNKAITRTAYLFSGIAVVVALFAGCSLLEQDTKDVMLPPEIIDVSNVQNASPEPLPLSKYGNPASYVVAGKRYYTMPASTDYKETGIASWYGTESQGKRTSSGEVYDNYGMTAAHRTLPLPSFVTVTNKQNGRSVIVKVNDRGPFHNNRLIELSYAAAVKLGIVGYGTGLVEISSIDPEEYNKEQGQILRQAGKQLFLQAGAFQARKNAEHRRAEIESKALGPVRIIEPSATNSPYLVQVGPFKDAAEAEQAANILKPMGISAVARYELDAAGVAQAETLAMQTSTPEPAAVTSMAETVAMETAEPATDEPEVMAMESSSAESVPDTGTSKWKFWQWLPEKLKPETGMPAVAAGDTAIAAAATGTGMAADAVMEPVAVQAEPAISEPEVVAMESSTAESMPDTGTSKWKFWQWRPAKSEPEGSMPAETTTNLVTAAPESVPETSEPEVVAMESSTAESMPDTGTSKWKFWQWRPAKSEPEGSMPAETTTNLVTAAPESVPETSEPEVVAMESSTAESMPDTGTSKWKVWKWLPEKLKPGTGMPAEAASDTTIAAAQTGTEGIAAMEPVAAQTETQTVQTAREDAVYLQTGAFRLRENAERLRPNVESLAPGAFNIIETSGTRKLYKIEIGPLRNTEEAMLLKSELRAYGINPSIVGSSGGSMLATASRYTTKPIEQLGKPATSVAKPATRVMDTVVSAPVKTTTAAPVAIATPYTKAPVPAAEKKPARVSAAEQARHEPARIEQGRRGKKALYQQAGAFARPKNATHLQEKIVDNTQEPTEIFVEPTDLPARGLITLHKVQVGPLENKSEAMEVKRTLEPLGITDSFPVYRQE